MSNKRLAIIGCGSSGLITLKMAIDFLPNWKICCYEKTDSIVGCWGNPHPGFVSTSTKFTTQFSCHPICDATVLDDAGQSRAEFFKNDEFGKYLESFAEKFKLHNYILLDSCVEHLKRDGDQWNLTINGESESFDAVVVCTGLAAKPKSIECQVEQLSAGELNSAKGLDHVTGRKIVVVGGGESAVDFADRLAKPELGNEVLLSLHSGVRVSPRYHPVKGVPSDFLRNRLMLSVHSDIRNFLGQKFVELRIKYERQFRRLFPGNHSPSTDETESEKQLRTDWTFRLTEAAKDNLFNMFHNKSDDFLNNVGKGQIRIVGPATDESWNEFKPFGDQEKESIKFAADLVVPGIGFQSTLGVLADERVSIGEFFLGCSHAHHDNLFAVGFARPIIGNIPTISEIQARYVCSLIAGKVARPIDIRVLQEAEKRSMAARFPSLNLEAVHPVEMFPYCDRLANLMGMKIGPSFLKSPLQWWRTQTSPATTLHYLGDDDPTHQAFDAKRYMPWTLVCFILLMKPVDWAWKLWKRLKP